MNHHLLPALFLNLLLCACEIYTLGKLRRKQDLGKYYTFLQNALALTVSLIFSLCLTAALLFACAIPGWVRGLRYVVTCGLLCAAMIYWIFLSSNQHNRLSDEDFHGLSAKRADGILHFLTPLLALLSFVFFERQIPLEAPVWTALAPLPSVVYWLVYLILSATKRWEAPYVFLQPGDEKKQHLAEALPLLLIPAIFMLISFLLWNVR